MKSFFGDRTRYDESRRTPRAKHGYHAGLDISADEGTPLVAVADREVIHKDPGGKLVEQQIFPRHTPEDTGLPIWLYSKYKHFRTLPDLEIGQRVAMGQVIGLSGKTGTVGGHYGRRGYPHLHLSVYPSGSGAYRTMETVATPKDVRHLGPLAVCLGKERSVTDNHAVRALPKAAKVATTPYKTTDGGIIPADTRLIWPFLCEPK